MSTLISSKSKQVYLLGGHLCKYNNAEHVSRAFRILRVGLQMKKAKGVALCESCSSTDEPTSVLGKLSAKSSNTLQGPHI